MDKKENFFQDVYEVVKLIPFGRVTSYGAIAHYLGAKGSARMVGWALNQSFGTEEQIPAHRVVNRNGMLTGKHFFPVDRPMDKLLQQEHIQVKDDKIINFKEVYWDPSEELV